MITNRIHGLSSIRRLPRRGKIRLGIKKKTSAGKEYPAEVDYFVCPPEVQAVYGEKPKELDVMFPVEDETVIFPQAYKAYSNTHLICKGDGKNAVRHVRDLTDENKKELDSVPGNPEELVEIQCPCPWLDSGKCKQVGNLMLLLPRVTMGGVYQIDTGSINNIINLNSAIDYARSLCGQISMVPMKLRREPQTIEYKGKKATHYLLALSVDLPKSEILKIRSGKGALQAPTAHVELPAPVEDGPEPTGPAPVEDETDDGHETLSYTDTIKSVVENKPTRDYVLTDGSDARIRIKDRDLAVRAYAFKGHKVKFIYYTENETAYLTDFEAVEPR